MNKFLIASFFSIILLPLASFANLIASPGFVHFYQVKVGAQSFQTAQIINQSNRPVSAFVNSDCFQDFSTSTGSCNYLTAFGSCTIFIYFQPTQEGPASCQITVNAGPAGTAYVFVRGQGIK